MDNFMSMMMNQMSHGGQKNVSSMHGGAPNLQQFLMSTTMAAQKSAQTPTANNSCSHELSQHDAAATNARMTFDMSTPSTECEVKTPRQEGDLSSYMNVFGGKGKTRTGASNMDDIIAMASAAGIQMTENNESDMPDSTIEECNETMQTANDSSVTQTELTQMEGRISTTLQEEFAKMNQWMKESDERLHAKLDAVLAQLTDSEPDS